MKRVLGLVAVAGVAAAVYAVPAAVPRLGAARGVTIADARWCGAGLCLTDLTRGGMTVARAEVHLDRSVDLYDVVADPGGVRAETEAEGGATSGVPVTSVRVHGLQIAGVPLPALSGELFPTRTLRGEGVEIIDDVARASVASPWGEVEVEARLGADGIAVSARCAACTVTSRALAEESLRLPVVVAEGTVRGETATGTVRIGDVTVEVTATRDGQGARGDFRLPATPIADVYAVFGAIIPELRRGSIGGTVEGEGVFVLPDGEIRFTPAVEGFAVDGVLPPGYDRGPFRRMVRTATDSRELRVFGEGSGGWISRMGAGEFLPMAIIAAEDAQFRRHPGYDLDGMLAAAEDNRERGEVWRGGSTLTQQLAKNLFLDGTRTYARKARELLYAVEMESDLGKARILELYLNAVEWGPGIYGARDAAQVYFLKSPGGLLPEEAAWLASILPYPRSAWRDQYLRGRPNLPRVHTILDNMVGLSEEARAAAKGRGVHFVPP